MDNANSLIEKYSEKLIAIKHYKKRLLEKKEQELCFKLINNNQRFEISNQFLNWVIYYKNHSDFLKSFDASHYYRSGNTPILSGIAKNIYEKSKDKLIKKIYDCSLKEFFPLISDEALETIWSFIKRDLTKDKYDEYYRIFSNTTNIGKKIAKNSKKLVIK